MLLKEYQLHGKKWAKLAQKLPGRTDNAVKNRLNSLLRKATQSRLRPSAEEETKFIQGEETS